MAQSGTITITLKSIDYTGDKSPGTNSQLSSSQSILPPYLAVYMWKRIN